MCLHFLISPYWQAKDDWTPSSYQSRTYLFYIANIIVADGISNYDIDLIEPR